MNFNNFLVNGIVIIIVGLFLFIQHRGLAEILIKTHFKFPNNPLYQEAVKYLPNFTKYLGIIFMVVGIVYIVKYFI